MANMRIHELSKEINIPSKEIVGMLAKHTNKEGLTHMSSVSEADIAFVKKSAGIGAAAKSSANAEKSNATVKRDGVVKTAGTASKTKVENKPKTETATPETENKKSHITQVYNPQNSSKGGYNRNNDSRSNDNRNNQSGYRQNGYNNRNNDNNRSNDNRNSQGGYQGGYNRNNDNRSGDNRNSQGGYQGGYNRNNDNRSSDNRNSQGGYQGSYNRNNDNRSNDNRNSQGGYNNRSNDNRNGQGGYQGGYNRNNDNRSGDNRNSQGGYNNRSNDSRNGQGGYQGGYNRNNDNRSGDNRNSQGGYNNRNNQGGYNNRSNDNRSSQGGYNRSGDNRNAQGRRNDAPKEEFVIITKPESRRVDNRKNDKNDRNKKDKDSKENLKFVSNFAPKKPVHQPKPKEAEEDTIKTLTLPDILTIKELADKMKVVPSAVVKKLFLQGKIVTINQEIDYDTAEEIALEFNCICEHEVKIDYIAELLKEDEEDPDTLTSRPPVVCVMGHVDHGKTSLLDAIRSANVTAKESGGITQHIGAYTVQCKNQPITFLDTPGHEAFTAMRMRGAQSTDIAILVVAADDGVMPQTVEAINHAKAAEIDIIVAINKVDKPNANIERVKQELTEYELIPEDWGGETIFVPVSAHTREGIDTLLEMILLSAEMRELKANPNRKARGLVIEAQLDKGKGPVATILVQKGTLKVGDNVAAGSCYGKIRAMTDDKGRSVKLAGPSTPVEILGLNDVPNAGEIIVATDNDKEARSFAETFIRDSREKLLADTKAKLSLDDLFSQIKAGNLKELGIIVKADVQGSVEAVKQSLVKLSNEEVAVKIIHGGVGNINESDVTLASASNAIIIGFNVKPDNQARLVADREKVDLRLYKVIYNAIEDVEAALKGMLEPIYEEKVMGHAEIKQIFKASVIGNIAGALVVDGKITKNSTVRIKRGDNQIFEGPLATLKRFKDEVKEVKAGYECGLVFEGFDKIEVDDVVEAYEMVEVPR